MARLIVEMDEIKRVADLQVFLDLLALLDIDPYGDHPVTMRATGGVAVAMHLDSILPLPERSDSTESEV